MKGTEDMTKRGILIAQKKSNFGYIGDYYVLASKRAAFYYVALGPNKLSAYALTKQFMFKQLFKKFPGLHSEMLAESFSRYIREFRKPCGRKRTDTIKKLNSKKQYSQVNLDSNKEEVKKSIVKIDDKNDGKDSARAQVVEKQE